MIFFINSYIAVFVTFFASKMKATHRLIILGSSQECITCLLTKESLKRNSSENVVKICTQSLSFKYLTRVWTKNIELTSGDQHSTCLSEAPLSVGLWSPWAHLHMVRMLQFMSNINQPSFPTPFHSVLVSISVFMALSTVFHSINSPDNSPFSDSVLTVLSLPYCSYSLISALLLLQSSLCLIGPFNFIFLYDSLLQPWYNP